MQKQNPGKPGKDMIIKESEKLNKLATITGRTFKQLSIDIVGELKHRNLVDDISDNYGCKIREVLNRQITVNELAQLMCAIGVIPRSEYCDTIMNSVLFGSGDCPKCGGEMETTDGEYKQTGGFDYDSEPEYTPLWEQKTCTHCGHTESNEPSY